ncbi:MAG TPA: hypothetical protein VD962_13340 [Rubricoccaceae bacterium]|nr:hypothetical protein [Rubricoccaceae bacterium]
MRGSFRSFALVGLLAVAGCSSGDPDDDNNDGGLSAADRETLETALGCDTVASLSLDDAESAALSTTDCAGFNGSYIDYYGFRLTSATGVVIEMESDEMNPYLWLYNAEGDVIAQNDDIEPVTNLNSRIQISLEAGLYAIGANNLSTGVTGAYTVRLDQD